MLPSAVRNYEVEKTPFFSSILPSEEDLRVSCKFENPHTLVEIGAVGPLAALDLAEISVRRAIRMISVQRNPHQPGRRAYRRTSRRSASGAGRIQPGDGRQRLRARASHPRGL